MRPKEVILNYLSSKSIGEEVVCSELCELFQGIDHARRTVHRIMRDLVRQRHVEEFTSSGILGENSWLVSKREKVALPLATKKETHRYNITRAIFSSIGPFSRMDIVRLADSSEGVVGKVMRELLASGHITPAPREGRVPMYICSSVDSVKGNAIPEEG